MFTVSDLFIINVFIIVNASLSYHTIHMAISHSCTHSCFIWQIFQNIITWVLEKACFPFFQTNQSTSGREKMTCDSIWHCYQSTAFRARIGESDWVVSRLIWRASVDKTSYLLHTVWSQNWRAVFILQEYYPTSPWRKRMDTTRIFWLLKGSLGPSSTKLRLLTSHSGLYRWI